MSRKQDDNYRRSRANAPRLDPRTAGPNQQGRWLLPKKEQWAGGAGDLLVSAEHDVNFMTWRVQMSIRRGPGDALELFPFWTRARTQTAAAVFANRSWQEWEHDAGRPMEFINGSRYPRPEDRCVVERIKESEYRQAWAEVRMRPNVKFIGSIDNPLLFGLLPEPAKPKLIIP